MSYTDQLFHDGDRSDGVSVKDATKLASALNNIDTAIQAVGDLAATATALTGVSSVTGTLTGSVANITYNATWSQTQANEINLNIKELATQVNALIADVAALKAKLT